MEIKELTLKEKKVLDMRGFIIKEFITYRHYLVTIFGHLGLTVVFSPIFLAGIIFISSFSENINHLLMNLNEIFGYPLLLLLVFLLLFEYIYITYKYTLYKNVLITKNGFITNNNFYSNEKDIPMKILDQSMRINKFGKGFIDFLFLRGNFIKDIRSNKKSSDNQKGIVIAGIIWLISIPVTLIFYTFVSIISRIGGIISQGISRFMQFSQFIHLCHLLEEFSLEIKNQSKILKMNFEKDMNFSVLSSGFDSLSSTFSRIVSLVIRLERVEKKANKGNLFDSEKYINSLRSDIVEPLKSLRSFLEDQREKLLQSQKELSRVGIGGADPSLHSGGQKVRVRIGADPLILSGGQEQVSGGLEQSDLSSKRSEKLIVELAENIEKLDTMIGRMA